MYFNKLNIKKINLNSKLKIRSILIYLFIWLSLFVDLNLDLDLSSGGSSSDFKNTFPVIINLLNLSVDGWSDYTRHFPLHYFLLSIIYKFLEDDYLVRLIYIIISLFIPLLVFYNLKYIYKKINVNNLLIFSSLILLLPFLRSSIVWSNSHATGLIFYLISNLFLQKFLYFKKIKSLILSILFLSFAVYSVQYYAAFFLIFLLIIFQNFEIKIFILSLILCFISSLPGFYFLKIMPSTGDIPFSTNIFNTLIINFSIFCFYLLMFINKKSVQILYNNFKSQKYNSLLSILIICIFVISINNFDYSFKVGGGFFYKLSYILSNGKYLFYLSAILGSFLFFYQTDLNKENILKLLMFILTFFLMTSSYMIFQKYFEPLFVLICLFYLKNEYFLTIFIDQNLFFVFLIIFSYFVSSIIYINFIF